MSAEKSISELSKKLNHIFALDTQSKKNHFSALMMQEYFSVFEVSLEQKDLIELIEKGCCANLPGWTLIDRAGEFVLFRAINLFDFTTECRWVLILRSIREHCLIKFENFPEINQSSNLPGSEIQLLKLFEWQEQNPDDFPPLALIATVILRLYRMQWIENARQTYFFINFKLTQLQMGGFLYSLNLEHEFKTLINVESGAENRAITNFANFIYQQLALSREEFAEQQNSKNNSDVLPKLPEFLFGKGIRDNSSKAEIPDPQLLHEEAEFIAHQTYSAMQKHCQNLDQTDQDLRYLISQTGFDRKTLATLMKKLENHLDHQIYPSEIRWFHESQVKLIAPHGSYWRGIIPNNLMNIFTIELIDQIMQLYTMELSWKLNDPQSILKKSYVHSEVLRRIYILDLKSEESNRDWIAINREVFFHFLGRLEEETVKWSKKKSSERYI